MRFKISATKLIVAVLAGISGGAISCTQPDTETVATAPSLKLGATSTRAREDFHRRNPQDWVGALHNKGVARFIARLGEGGIPAGGLCAAILEFDLPAADLPPQARNLDPQVLMVGMRTTLARTGCGRKGNDSFGRRVSMSAHIPAASATTMSQDALDLLLAISAIAELEPGADSTAVLLLPILAAADSLTDGDEGAVVQGVASIAQASAEYWEANGDEGSEEVRIWVENNCEGYSYEDCIGQVECSPPDCWETSSPESAPSFRPLVLTLASYATKTSCQQPRKGVIWADVDGAVVGFFAGIWVGPGLLGTAGIGAYAASTGTFATNLIKFWGCMLNFWAF